MDFNTLESNLGRMTYSGHALGATDAVVLRDQLLLLEHTHRFRQIFFLGRIQGTTGDYSLAFGYKNDVITGRVCFYCVDGRNWVRLPRPTAMTKRLALMVPSMFTGDPAHTVTVAKEGFESDDETVMNLDTTLREEDRLAAVIKLLLTDAAIAPRGALYKRMDGTVVVNEHFSGLTTLQAPLLSNYKHMRRPRRRWDDNLRVHHDYNHGTDFLDPLSAEQPTPWIIQPIEGGLSVALYSLLWPGMIFFHTLDSQRHAFMYMGSGLKNIDFPFML